MKISALSLSEVKQWLRIEYDEDDALVAQIMDAAKSQLVGMTGLTEETVCGISEMGYAFLCLCQQMYDVRDLTVGRDSINPNVMQIVRMHAVNYL